MKLTELAIEGNSISPSVHFGNFDHGLNFVYGENGGGKSRLRSFVHNILQTDSQSSVADVYRQAQPHFGSLNVATGGRSYAFRLAADRPDTVHVDSHATANGSAPAQSVAQLIGHVDPALYNTVYNFSLRSTANLRQTLASVLQQQLNVPTGPEAAAEDVNRAARQRQAEERRNRLESLHRDIEARRNERTTLSQQIGSADAARQADVFEVNRQIEQLDARIGSLNPTLSRTQLAAIEQDILNLQTLINNAAVVVTEPVATVPAVDNFSDLYRRLDEVDQQIQRWRDVQSDVQNQRVRLKDEMVVWNEMTLESDEHPYHNAREILIGLEARVDQTEQTARRWAGTTATQIDVAQMADDVEDICKQMRDDLYGLCHELAHQYKHIRQRAAAEELKQLRRCYHEMGENTKRLVQRRQQVILEIRSIDPAGADAIVRSEQRFCQCAHHEGYLAARRRFLGEVQSVQAVPVVQRTVQPDLTLERERLAAFQVQRNTLLQTISRSETDLVELERQRVELLRHRDAISGSVDTSALNEQLRLIELELVRLENDHRLLSAQIEADNREIDIAPHPVLVNAGQLLSQMSGGSLSQVFLMPVAIGDPAAGTSSVDLQVRDSQGKVHNFDGLDGASRDQAYLSLALATSETLRSSSIQLPIVIDDAFANIGPDRVDATLTALRDFSQRHDQQIFLLSQHRYLADRLPGLPVFELPPMLPEALPIPHAEPLPRTTPAYTPTVRPLKDPGLVASGIVANVLPPVAFPTEPSTSAYPQHANSRPYPLSKYPANPAALASDPLESDYQLPWSPLNQSFATQSQSVPTRHVAKASTSASVPVTTPPLAARTFETEEAITESANLQRLQLFDVNRLNNLGDCGVVTIEQLLRLELDNLHVAFQDRGISLRQIERWQAQAWLMLAIPVLNADDARILVACGITAPEHLETSHNGQVLERIQRFLASPEGERYQRRRNGDRGTYALSMDTVDRWYRALDRNRSRWSGRRSSYRRSSRSGRSRRSQRDYSDRDRQDQREPRARTYQVGDYPQRQRMSSPEAGNRQRTAALAPRSSRSSGKKSESRVSSVTSASKSNETRLKFYLELTDHIEAAPSIGPKTAERFEKIGVITVADFLKQTAESMATRLNYKRITADVVLTWQHQTRLVCRIPNLRGHDAQLLVACGVTEPEELSVMQPQKLFDVVGPFSDTKDGLKIIRSGKKPDLAEITDWIQWAGHTRSLQAA